MTIKYELHILYWNLYMSLESVIRRQAQHVFNLTNNFITSVVLKALCPMLIKKKIYIEL